MEILNRRHMHTKIVLHLFLEIEIPNFDTELQTSKPFEIKLKNILNQKNYLLKCIENLIKVKQ